MGSNPETHLPETVDFADIKFAIAMVVVGLTMFFTRNFVPDAGLNRYVTDIIASFCCVAYILPRARRHPDKLDEWGLTTRLSPAGRIAGVGLVGLRAGIPALLYSGEYARQNPAFARCMAGGSPCRGLFRSRPSIAGRIPLAPHPAHDGLHRSDGIHGCLLFPPVPQPLAHRRATRYRVPHAHRMGGPDYPVMGLTQSPCHHL